MSSSLLMFSVKCGFHGARERLRRMRMSKNGKVQQSYFMLQKIAKPSRGFGSVVNCSRASFLVRREFQKVLTFLANVSRIPGRVLLVICSQTCLKSFVILMRRTYSRRARCSQNLRKSPNQITTVCRMSRASSEVCPIIYRPFCEPFAYVLRHSHDIRTYVVRTSHKLRKATPLSRDIRG